MKQLSHAESKIATTYGTALFDAAMEQGVKLIDGIYNDFEYLLNILRCDNSFAYKKLCSPLIDYNDKIRIVGNIFKDKIESYLLELINVLLAKGRFSYVFEVFSVYSSLRDERSGVLRGEIRVAKLPEKKREDMIINSLSKITGKEVKADFIEDPTIMAGFVTFLGTYYVDYSLSGHLKRMEDKLKRSETHGSA